MWPVPDTFVEHKNIRFFYRTKFPFLAIWKILLVTNLYLEKMGDLYLSGFFNTIDFLLLPYDSMAYVRCVYKQHWSLCSATPHHHHLFVFTTCTATTCARARRWYRDLSWTWKKMLCILAHLYQIFLVFLFRDLLNWCSRIAYNFDSSSSNTAVNIFQEVR